MSGKKYRPAQFCIVLVFDDHTKLSNYRRKLNKCIKMYLHKKFRTMARRNFLDRGDLLDWYTHSEIIERYRLDRQAIIDLAREIEPHIAPHTRRNHSLTVVEKTLVSLRYLATTVIQLNDAGLHLISQPTVSRTVNSFIETLSSPAIFTHHVRFPTTEAELRTIKEDFFQVKLHFDTFKA